MGAACVLSAATVLCMWPAVFHAVPSFAAWYLMQCRLILVCGPLPAGTGSPSLCSIPTCTNQSYACCTNLRPAYVWSRRTCLALRWCVCNLFFLIPLRAEARRATASEATAACFYKILVRQSSVKPHGALQYREWSFPASSFPSAATRIRTKEKTKKIEILRESRARPRLWSMGQLPSF